MDPGLLLSRRLSPDPADLYSPEPGEEEPAWVQTEREQFRDFRDLNKDGRLDASEVGHWVLPPAQDQPLVEANHLLQESDTDKVPMGVRRPARGGCSGCAQVTRSWAWSCMGPCLDGERDRESGRGTKGWGKQDPERGTGTQRGGQGSRDGDKNPERGTGTWRAILRSRDGSHMQGTELSLLTSDLPPRTGV